MKKTITITIISILIITVMTLMASCGGGKGSDGGSGSGSSNGGNNSAGNGSGGGDSSKIQVVTTIFPEYDWARSIVGRDNKNVDVTLLVNNGADLHSYQPTVDDIMKISSSDIFVYVGGESDEWVGEVLEKASNKEIRIVCLMDALGDKAKEEEEVEGMDDHGHDDDDDHDHDHDEVEYDEHVWLSLRNAAVFCEEISDALCDADPENSDTYEKNVEAYLEKLRELDLTIDRMTAEAGKNVLVFGDRFPFRYFTDDYDIRYFAAFTGCSAETEASFETIRFLANKVDRHALDYVMKIDGSDGSVARTVADNTKRKVKGILTLDSMQSVTQKQIDKGKTYIGVMEKNLSVLEKALAFER